MSVAKNRQTVSQPEPISGEPISKVTIILPAYNEEACIEEKLSNLKERCDELTLDYEVLIGSDGSTDKTVELAHSFIANYRLHNWKVFDFSNAGKCQTINRLVQQSTGECILSTDSDTILQPLALKALITMFQENSSAGCISSFPVYDLGEKSIQEKYWSIDLLIRSKESENGDLIVINGWLYGFRKTAFESIPHGVMADDLWIPLTVLLDGWKCFQCRESISTCHRTDEQEELHKRRRVIAGGMDVVFRLFNRLTSSPTLLCIVFLHKVNRWMLSVWIPFAIISFFFFFNPSQAVAYLFVLFFILMMLIPRIRNIMITLTQPVLAFFKVIRTRNLGKWDHVGRQ